MNELDLFSSERRQKRLRFYKLGVWKRIRSVQLRRKPLCEMCEENGKLTPATICDHQDCMWETTLEGFTKGPFSSLCKNCHDIKTQEIDLPKMMRAEKLKMRSF